MIETEELNSHSALQNSHYNRFIDPNTGLQLTYSGDYRGGRWNNGVLVSNSGKSYPVVSGIPNFVGHYDDALGRQCVEEDWIQRNHEYRKKKPSNQRTHLLDAFLKQMTDSQGIILEIAAGPSGGNAPSVLMHNLDASILLNDISYLMLEQWKDLLQREGYRNISFAAFDIRSMPLESGSFDIVSDYFGINNIVSDVPKAVSEVDRILRKGGCLYSVAINLCKKDVEKLPTWLRDEINEQYLCDYEQLFTKTGLKMIDKEYLCTRRLYPDESGIASVAQDHYVILRAELYTYVFVKQE